MRMSGGKTGVVDGGGGGEIVTVRSVEGWSEDAEKVIGMAM